MSDLQGMCSIHLRNSCNAHSPSESRNGGIIIGLRRVRATMLPVLPFLLYVCAYISLRLTRWAISLVYRAFSCPFAAITRLVHHILMATVIVHVILSGMSGITLRPASHAHAVARNGRTITLAFCALPVPFKDTVCSMIGTGLPSPFDSNLGRSPTWHPFLINDDAHGPAVDFAICKPATVNSALLALVRDSDIHHLPQARHRIISDTLKDLFRCARMYAYTWNSYCLSQGHDRQVSQHFSPKH